VRRPSVMALVTVALALGGCADGGSVPVEPSFQAPETSSGTSLPPEAYADALVAETNAARVGEGLEPLSPSTCAKTAALDRARDLVGLELKHAPLAPVIEACAPMTMAAENLVDSAAPPDDVVDAWMNSPGHRANIVDPSLTELGISCVEYDVSQRLCSQVFVGP
jgi:uncharacterized protein YkwD